MLLVFFAVTFNSDDLAPIGTYVEIISDTSNEISVNVGNPGLSQTWDYSDKTEGRIFKIQYINPDDAEYKDSFPNANRVHYWHFTDEDGSYYTWAFYKVSSDKLEALGNAHKAEKTDTTIEIVRKFDTPHLITTFPLNFNTSWRTSWEENDTFSVGALDIITHVLDTSYSIVDGEGILKVPKGNFNALRIKTYDTSITFTTVGNFTDTTITTEIKYTWLVKKIGNSAFITSKDNETDDNFTQAKDDGYLYSTSYILENYKGKSDEPFNIEIKGNNLYLNIKSGIEELEIFNILGKKIVSSEYLKPKNYHYELNNGVFFIKITTDSQTYIKKITVIN